VLFRSAPGPVDLRHCRYVVFPSSDEQREKYGASNWIGYAGNDDGYLAGKQTWDFTAKTYAEIKSKIKAVLPNAVVDVDTHPTIKGREIDYGGGPRKGPLFYVVPAGKEDKTQKGCKAMVAVQKGSAGWQYTGDDLEDVIRAALDTNPFAVFQFVRLK
jgi:hypothetical protein